MSERTLRTEIDEVLAEMNTVKAELILRLGNLREYTLTGLKVTGAALAALVGVRIAWRLMRALLGFIGGHKLGAALLSALVLAGWYAFAKTSE